jgi:hypothetical protein
MPVEVEMVFSGLEACASLEGLARSRATLLRSLRGPAGGCRVFIAFSLDENRGESAVFRAAVELMWPSGDRIVRRKWTTEDDHPGRAVDHTFDAIVAAIDQRPPSVAARTPTTRIPAQRRA